MQQGNNDAHLHCGFGGEYAEGIDGNMGKYAGDYASAPIGYCGIAEAYGGGVYQLTEASSEKTISDTYAVKGKSLLHRSICIKG